MSIEFCSILECVAKHVVPTFRHLWTKVHVQRRFSINILLQWEDVRHRPI